MCVFEYIIRISKYWNTKLIFVFNNLIFIVDSKNMEYKYQVLKDGSRYEGTFVHDKAEGYGIYTHKDGTRYEGEWKDDKVKGFREM